ncbi:MAG TPA: hypothetical protein VK255_02555 [Patescibacteria group bacterium]|nr:hypothetical protein [Patescibacteria group bacterium]
MSKKIEDIKFIDILKRSFDITWKNKPLWWFGLLLALGGGMGNINLGLDEKNNKVGEKISHFISANFQVFVIGVILGIAILLILFILSILARGGLILSLEKIFKNRTFNFRSGMKEGKNFFARLFFLYLVLCLLILASLVILATPIVVLFTSKAFVSAILLIILAVIIFIPLIIFASYLKTYGEIYIVSADLNAWSAIEASYELFIKNMSTSLVMGLLFIPIGILLGLAILITIAPLGLAVVFFAFLGKIGIAIAIILGIVILLAIVLIQTVFQIFHQTAWLLFFHDIAAPTEEEKVEETISEPAREKILPAAGDAVKMMENDK